MNPHRYSEEENTIIVATRLTFFLYKDNKRNKHVILCWDSKFVQKYQHYNSKKVSKKQSSTFVLIKFVFTKQEIALACIYNPAATGQFITEDQS